ncbi:hypothetical protein K435DRAFT_959570 [Dendrothele bispora CBS 962.96]|uniref:Translation elongation factor EFTs/EF1B dimerisation domain-containing protein n=1 Tax=Dendrothele bispora (strain CBS 962.96) TaxID=1314807 RepID=A0A4S8MWH9_DENBC|nr:hypothetical protein K435DRAFT_959570 [Dendrothele bispora CBS 962.96]
MLRLLTPGTSRSFASSLTPRPATTLSLRSSSIPKESFYSTSSSAPSSGPQKSKTLQLLSSLRKQTNAPIHVARRALEETGNDFDAAVKWIEKDLLESGMKKAEKMKDRKVGEGLVSVEVVNGGWGAGVKVRQEEGGGLKIRVGNEDGLEMVIPGRDAGVKVRQEEGGGLKIRVGNGDGLEMVIPGRDAGVKVRQEEGGGLKIRVGNGDGLEGELNALGNGNGGGVQAAIIELNCESDFVSRTSEFASLSKAIARAVAKNANVLSPTKGQQASSSFLTRLDVESLKSLPLGNDTIHKSLMDFLAKAGENIVLRRAALLTSPSPNNTDSKNTVYRVASYVHRSTPEFPSQGRVGALALLSLRAPNLSSLLTNAVFITDLQKLERAICRQTAGFITRGIRERVSEEDELETALYKQPFAMLGGDKAGLPVREVLDEWQKKWELDEFEVADFARWELGEQDP